MELLTYMYNDLKTELLIIYINITTTLSDYKRHETDAKPKCKREKGPQQATKNRETRVMVPYDIIYDNIRKKFEL